MTYLEHVQTFELSSLRSMLYVCWFPFSFEINHKKCLHRIDWARDHYFLLRELYCNLSGLILQSSFSVLFGNICVPKSRVEIFVSPASSRYNEIHSYLNHLFVPAGSALEAAKAMSDAILPFRHRASCEISQIPVSLSAVVKRADVYFPPDWRAWGCDEGGGGDTLVIMAWSS